MVKESGAGCGGESCGKKYVRAGNYTLQTKNYPAKYSTLTYCKWELVADNPKSTMEFSCSDFDMLSYDDSCEWDWMSVNGTRFCNNNWAPTATIKSYGAISVEYSTPDLPDKTRGGFSCTVTVTDPK